MISQLELSTEFQDEQVKEENTQENFQQQGKDSKPNLDEESYIGKEQEHQNISKKMALIMTKKVNGGFKSQELHINLLSPLRKKSKGNNLKDTDSEDKEESKSQQSLENQHPNTFAKRTKGFRDNIKSTLQINLHRNLSNGDVIREQSIYLLNDLNSQIQVEQYRNDFEKGYEEGEILGEGCSAIVKRCKHRLSLKDYAVKIMRNFDEERMLIAKQEFDILKNLNHPNIVKVKEFLVSQQEIFMVMELIKGKELFDKISEIEKYDENIAKKLFAQILEAVNYLHAKGICHRDIKPSNILVLDNEDKIKLMDFNISKMCSDQYFKMMTHTGTEAFCAPEMFSQAIYNEKIDLWSSGCVLYTMLSGFQPFFEEKTAKLHKLIKLGIYDIESDPWPTISSQAKDLVQKLLEIDPDKRLSAQQALKHPWFHQQQKVQTLSSVRTKFNQRQQVRRYSKDASQHFDKNLFPNTDYDLLLSKLHNGLVDYKQLLGSRGSSFHIEDAQRVNLIAQNAQTPQRFATQQSDELSPISSSKMQSENSLAIDVDNKEDPDGLNYNINSEYFDSPKSKDLIKKLQNNGCKIKMTNSVIEEKLEEDIE